MAKKATTKTTAAEPAGDDVAVIDIAQEKAIAAFSNRIAFDAMVADVRKAALALIPENPNMAHKKDRDAVRSLAAKIPKLKTKVDAWGASLVDNKREEVKSMDALRKEFRDDLDALKDEIRKPLTDWEDAEEARIYKIKVEMDKARDLGQVKFGETSKMIQKRIDELPTHELSFYEEFKDEAQLILEAAFNQLTTAKTAAKNAEDAASAAKKAADELEALKAHQLKDDAQKEARANILTIQNIGHGILNNERGETADLIDALKAMKITSAYGELIDDANEAWRKSMDQLLTRKDEEAKKKADDDAKAAADKARDDELDQAKKAKDDADKRAEQAAIDAQKVIDDAAAAAEQTKAEELRKAGEVTQRSQEQTAVRIFTETNNAGETQEKAMAEARDDIAETLIGKNRESAPLAIVAAVIGGKIRHIRFEV